MIANNELWVNNDGTGRTMGIKRELQEYFLFKSYKIGETG